MTNLQKLTIGGYYCGVTDDEIKDLNLIQLDATDNPKISKISHMTNLQKLNIGCNSGVTDNEIKDLNLIELKAYENLSKDKERNFRQNCLIKNIDFYLFNIILCLKMLLI